ncbi:hypothetical protein CDD80_7429 [Ophiocordyceps camponoti-rufipedis]|uniref:Tetratricopeptide repeat protein 1 n=1 Tax=Ophiocordyceps camponoti-rufipedis TaxID=2004952 RepID=A0A2C5YNS0_9HYPO|nr:hypothetical protein CDD80_7429 [Ophiocordyceps camponoti-rufipedis]
MADTNDGSASPELTAEEEATLQRESQAIKAEANGLFAAGDYHDALARYDDALASCPPRLGFDRAVLLSNVAAAHIRLEQWVEAIKAADGALEALTLQGEGSNSHERDTDGSHGRDTDGSNTRERDTDGEDMDGNHGKNTHGRATESSQQNTDSKPTSPSRPPQTPPNKQATDPPQQLPDPNPNAARIRTKALLRRAHARSQAGGWQNLSAAQSDYRLLLATPNLLASDALTVRRQLADLPPRTKAAQEAEMADMWGKLRSLGDGILRPFGLSTENFRLEKDEGTGGYSVNFDQGRGSS